MPAPEALSREKRTAILDGAGRVFASHGYEGASMADITRAAGVSKGTIYHHFAGKAELFGAYVAQQCASNLAPLFDDAQPVGDIGTNLRDIGLRMVHLLLSPAGLVVDRIVISEARRFPELARAFYDAGPARAIAALSGWLETQIAHGQLAIDDPEFAAEQFFSLCQHPAILRCKLGLVPSMDQAAIERVVDAAVAVFLKAYGSVPAGRISASPKARPPHLARPPGG